MKTRIGLPGSKGSKTLFISFCGYVWLVCLSASLEQSVTTEQIKAHHAVWLDHSHVIGDSTPESWLQVSCSWFFGVFSALNHLFPFQQRQS
jgi:hypothetical protein